MEDKSNKTKNNLTLLLDNIEGTDEEIANKIHVSPSLMKKMKSGNRRLTEENAEKLAQLSGVNVNWLLGTSPYKHDTDIMANIWLALGKVFKITERTYVEHIEGERCEHTEMQLLIDRGFYNYLVDIKKLENICSWLNMNDEDKELINKKRHEIHLKYNEYIKEVFNSDSFDEEGAVVITCGSDITIADLL